MTASRSEMNPVAAPASTGAAAPSAVDDGGPGPQARERPPPRPKLSSELLALSRAQGLERIWVSDIRAAIGRRSFGALMLIFAFPNILPSPPGMAGVLGAPLIFLSAQLMLRLQPWLPKVVAQRSMRRQDFAALVDRAAPWLARAERLLRPRWVVFSNNGAEVAIGALCLILSVVLVLPIPFGNLLPAFTICIFALGLLERDGVWVLVGVGAFFVTMTVVGGLAFATLKAAIFVIQGAFA